MQGSIKKNISKINSNQQNLVIGKATTKTNWIEWFSPLTTIIGNLLQITFTHHQRDDKKFFCRKREKRRKLLSGKGELRWGSYVSRFINDRLNAEMFSVRWTTSMDDTQVRKYSSGNHLILIESYFERSGERKGKMFYLIQNRTENAE